MSDIFNIRSFVGNQVDKLSSPKNLVDKFRQTVDNIKLPFSTTPPPSNSNERTGDLQHNDSLFNVTSI